MAPEQGLRGERSERREEMRVRLRARDSGLTRDKVIETVFSKTVPFIRIFGDFPNYVALCKEKDAYKLLKNETKTTLIKAGIEVQTPNELKVEEADKVLEKGLLLFHMFVTADQITREEFFNVQTCFRCYKCESHTTKDCGETVTRCSEYAEEGHRWMECKIKLRNA